MIRTSRVVRGVLSQSLPVSTKRDAREFEARALAARLVAEARNERAEEERVFDVLLAARRSTIANDARREASEQVIELAGLVAERLVGELAQSSQDIIVRLARDVVTEARVAGGARLAVAPAHVDIVRTAVASGALDSTLTVVSDETLAPGDVVLEQEKDRWRVDGRVQMRTSALLRVLARHWRYNES